MIGTCDHCGADGVPLRFAPGSVSDRPTICDRCHARLERLQADERRGFEGAVYEPADATAESEGVVYTAGISSAVLSSDEGDGPECLGHVLLLDLDDVDAIAAHRAASETDGIAAVLRSSEGSYHMWDLTVRSFEDAILDGLSWQIADSEHVAQSRRRGYFVLRATSKVRDDGSVYKAAPELLDVYAPTDLGDLQEPQSLPHFRRLEAMLEEQALDQNMTPPLDMIETVGAENGLSVDRYMTLDDAAKTRLRE